MSILSKSLAERNYAIDLVTYFDDNFFIETLHHPNINHLSFPKTEKIGYGVVNKLSKQIRKKNYFLILSFMTTPNIYAILSKILSRTATPVIISERTTTSFKTPTLKTRLAKFCYSKADAFTANAQNVIHDWKEQLPSNNVLFKYIGNCVDLNRFKFIKRSFATKNILVVGRVGPEKNGLCLVEALNHLNVLNKLDNIKVTWIGQKIRTDKVFSDYTKSMEELISNYKLDAYWSWEKPTLNIQEYYKNADVLILPSFIEGFPNVVCEALSTGLPIIITNINNLDKLTNNNKNGYSFDPKDSEELSQKILDYFALTIAEKTELSNNSKEYAQENFSVEKFTDKYISVFNEVATKNA